MHVHVHCHAANDHCHIYLGSTRSDGMEELRDARKLPKSNYILYHSVAFASYSPDECLGMALTCRGRFCVFPKHW